MAVTDPFPSAHNNTLLLRSVALRSWNTAVWERKQYREDEASRLAIKVNVLGVFPVVLMF